MKKKFILMLVLLSTVILTSGCNSSEGKENLENPEKLTVVTMPDENNPEAGGKTEGFIEDMKKSLGIDVELMEGSDYTSGIEAMKSGKLDVLLVSPMSYHQAKERITNGIEPVVTTKSANVYDYKTVFVTNSSNGDINSLEDLKGRKFAFVDPASSSGYLYPKYTLVKELNLDADKLEEPNYFFETVTYSGKHDTSLMGVAKGDYDAAAVAGQTIDTMAKANLIKKEDIKIIGESSLIPSPMYVMRSDLSQELKDKIKDFYLNYENEDYFETFYKDKTTRFVEVDLDDYTETEDMIKVLNIKGDVE